jgi:hypothetical protein
MTRPTLTTFTQPSRVAVLHHVIAAILTLGSLSAADWPGWRGPERTGAATADPALRDIFGSDKELAPAWEVTVPTPGGKTPNYACPIIATCFYLGEALRAIGPTSIPVLVQKDFGAAAKDVTPFLEKVAAAMPPGESTWEPYIEEDIEIVNGRSSKRVVGMGKHRTPCPLGVDDGSKPSGTSSMTGTEADEP